MFRGGFKGVKNVRVTPECLIFKNPMETPHNALVQYDRIIQNGTDRKSPDYVMHAFGVRKVTVSNEVKCPGKAFNEGKF